MFSSPILDLKWKRSLIQSVIGVIAGLFIIIGCLAGGSGPKASNRDVWVTVRNATGFESDSLCVLIGIVTAFYGYGIPHWLVNMADVVENPARTIPIALAIQQIGNGFTYALARQLASLFHFQFRELGHG